MPEKNSQISQAGVGRHRVRNGLQWMAGAGVEFVKISPVADSLDTGGPADWIPIHPGADTAVMLALAHEIRAADAHDRAFLHSYCVGWEQFEAYLTGARDGMPKTPDWAEPLSGVPAACIRDLASRMIGRRKMVNGSGHCSAQTTASSRSG